MADRDCELTGLFWKGLEYIVARAENMSEEPTKHVHRVSVYLIIGKLSKNTYSVLSFACVLKQVEKTIESHLSVIIKTCNWSH